MPKVSIVQEVVLPYRIPFFRRLKERMDEEGIGLDLFYGTPRTAVDIGDVLPWSTPVGLRPVGPFLWQSVFRRCHGSDMVIVPQQVRHLSSIALQLCGLPGKRKHAFWGHGRNMKDQLSNRRAEALKVWLSRRADWWFAYNDQAVDIVRGFGYPDFRISNVMNAIDTRELIEARQSLDDSALEAARQRLGIRSPNVAIYTGGIHPLKRIDFLLEAARLIRRRVPDFHLIVIGQGASVPEVEAAAARDPWIHYLGAIHGAAKVPYWALSKVLLMPGGVGLVALDSIALGVPMVTTANRLHGPEISYVRDGRNGVIVDPGDSVETYAEIVAGLLSREGDGELAVLRAGCREDADRYSLEDMVERFVEGVKRALASPRRRMGESHPSETSVA